MHKLVYLINCSELYLCCLDFHGQSMHKISSPKSGSITAYVESITSPTSSQLSILKAILKLGVGKILFLMLKTIPSTARKFDSKF